MKIVQINKAQFNIFTSAQKQTQFLQSYEWGEFQEAVGNKVLRLGIEDGGKLIFAVLLIKKKLPGVQKFYYYAPRIDNEKLSGKQLAFLFKEVKKIAKQEGVIFLRFEPQHKIQNTKYLPAQTGKIQKTIDVQPGKTLILDIGKSEEEMLKAMHQKTRYNIRLSEKKGVKVREANEMESDFETFWKIMEETKERDKFRLHGKDYYEKMLKHRNPGLPPTLKLRRAGKPGRSEEMSIKLYLAEYEGEVIAGNIVAFYGDMATYLHGASSNKYRNMMAPHALQWQTIKLAKQSGYRYYNFNGIDEKKWPGVTRFKRGFGGEEINYPGTFDAVFSDCWYKIYKAIRKIRRMV